MKATESILECLLFMHKESTESLYECVRLSVWRSVIYIFVSFKCICMHVCMQLSVCPELQLSIIFIIHESADYFLFLFF